jgi:hypothetical protein
VSPTLKIHSFPSNRLSDFAAADNARSWTSLRIFHRKPNSLRFDTPERDCLLGCPFNLPDWVHLERVYRRRAGELIVICKIDSMESGFPQPDVDVTDKLLIGAALLAPAFCDDLSTWRMTISRDGIVNQELSVAHHGEIYERVIVHLRSFVPPDVLANIEAEAREIRFHDFDSDYHAECTDLQHTSITLNLDTRSKRVTAYGPQMLAHDGNSDMVGYCRLWNMLLEIAPYQGTDSHPAPEDQVLERIRTIFGPW